MHVFASRQRIRDDAAMTAHAETHAHSHTIDALEDFAEFAYAHEWTDGLPVFPPTKKAVGAILDYLQRDPHEELGAIFPGDGIATIENVAANCAMAGCLPQYVPVVIAAVQCIADPALLITTTRNRQVQLRYVPSYKTNTWTPLDKTKFDALADEVDYLVVGVGA